MFRSHVCAIASTLYCSQCQALERGHALAISQLQQQQAAAQEGWRAALVERLKREAAEREEALRRQMVEERDAEIEVGAWHGHLGYELNV